MFFNKIKMHYYKAVGKMSFNLKQSLSLYIPFIRDNVSLETFQETFHSTNIGKVSSVDFVFNAKNPLREAFVHFEVFYDTQDAYDFQTNLVREQKMKIWYEDNCFWSISENFSKKKAMVGGRQIKLDLGDDDDDSRKWSDEDSQEEEKTYCPLSVQEELDYLRKEVIRLEQNALKMETDNSFLKQRNDDLMASMETFADEEIFALEEKLAYQDEEITMLTHQLEIQEAHFQMQLEVVAPTHPPHTRSLTCGVCYKHTLVIIPRTKGGCSLCSSHPVPEELPDDFPIQSALSFMKKMN